MTLKEKINIKKAVSVASIVDNERLLTVDEEGEFREYSLSDFSLKDTFNTNLKSAVWNKKISFSKDGEYLVFGVTDSQEIDIFSISEKDSIYKIGGGNHQGNILSTAVDPSGKYFISTSEDGRSFLWSLDTGRKIHAFPRRDTEVNIGVFNKSGDIIATGTEEGKVNVVNVSTMKDLGYFRINKPVRDLLFVSDKYLVSIDKENEVNLWRISDGKKIKNILKSKVPITKVALSTDEKFLYITNFKGKVILYNLIDHELENENYVQLNQGITNIIIMSELGDMLVTDKSGKICSSAIADDQANLMLRIKNKDYKGAYELVSKNKLLKQTKEFQVLEVLWDNIVKKAEEIIETGAKNTSKVEALLNPFAEVDEKKNEVREILADFKEYAKLNQYIAKGTYNLAYDVVKKHPNLEMTKSFKRLEATWNDSFRRAKMTLFKNQGEEQAREILYKFSGIPEKASVISNLFAQKNVYIQFVNFIKQKKYGQVMELVKRNPFLETNADYLKIIDILDDTYITMKVAMQRGEVATVLEMSKFLRTIPDLKNEADQCLQAIKQLKEFNAIVKEGKNPEILKFGEDKPFLKKHEAFLNAKDFWEKTVSSAESIAYTGDVKKVAESFVGFENVESRHLKIANIVKIAYLSDLNNTITENRDDLGIVIPILTRAIGNYLSMFGKDQEITDILENIEEVSGKRFDMEQFRIGKIERLSFDRLKDSILK
ncbi:WD40 repeat-containing protein [Thiovulum sp. ES]|nr:WD40 repeat-containing protein [Thiovulum sp. ES]